MISENPGQAHGAVPGAPLPAHSRSSRVQRALRVLLTLLVFGLIAGAIFADSLTAGGGLLFLGQRVQIFVTIFLGIFIEAVPFLIAGSIVSGLIAVFVDQSMLERFMPRNPILAAVTGASMGMVFPVCECGVVPVTRRLYEKGLPVAIGISFLLAAPVINPIVIISTYAAFGLGPVLWGRLGFSLLIASVVGLTFSLARPQDILLPQVNSAHSHAHHHPHEHHGPPVQAGVQARLQAAFNTAGDDFLDMVRYLIIGSMLAAAMQTLVPQSVLLSVGQGPIISVLAMQALAFVLSVCSTVDAFLALAFTGTFTTGSIIAFLTFGPMVDIKSSLMFLGVFQRRVVAYLIILPFLLAMAIGIFWNLNVGL